MVYMFGSTAPQLRTTNINVTPTIPEMLVSRISFIYGTPYFLINCSDYTKQPNYTMLPIDPHQIRMPHHILRLNGLLLACHLRHSNGLICGNIENRMAKANRVDVNSERNNNVFVAPKHFNKQELTNPSVNRIAFCTTSSKMNN